LSGNLTPIDRTTDSMNQITSMFQRESLSGLGDSG